jgi:sortase A
VAIGVTRQNHSGLKGHGDGLGRHVLPPWIRAVGVIGEVFLTVGVLVGLFMGWYLFINDAIQGSTQLRAAETLVDRWSEGLPEETEEASRDGAIPSEEEPPVVLPPGKGEGFAVLYVPRFGEGYARTIAEGVDLVSVLNSPELGVGRYPQSDELGAVGNFAIAGHRTTFGAAFAKIGELRVGDRLYVETEDGWYSYAFRNLEYVWPTELEVLNSFPKLTLESPEERIITLTSCHPRFSEAERIIAYGVFDGWYPREGGPPAEIAKSVEGAV